MEVAIALGLVLSELSPDPWHNRMITFTETPGWFQVPNTVTSLEERVNLVKQMPWGMSTNFNAALELVLQTAVEQHTSQGDMPQAMFVVRACVCVHVCVCTLTLVHGGVDEEAGSGFWLMAL